MRDPRSVSTLRLFIELIREKALSRVDGFSLKNLSASLVEASRTLYEWFQYFLVLVFVFLCAWTSCYFSLQLLVQLEGRVRGDEWPVVVGFSVPPSAELLRVLGNPADPPKSGLVRSLIDASAEGRATLWASSALDSSWHSVEREAKLISFAAAGVSTSLSDLLSSARRTRASSEEMRERFAAFSPLRVFSDAPRPSERADVAEATTVFALSYLISLLCFIAGGVLALPLLIRILDFFEYLPFETRRRIALRNSSSVEAYQKSASQKKDDSRTI